MIDLHTHTNYSDGTWDLTKLLLEANKAGVEVLSITDHDTLKAYEELKNISHELLFKGKILPGVELSAVYNGIKFELLAYGFDLDKLNKWIIDTYKDGQLDLNKEFEYMYNNCKKHNLQIESLSYDMSKGWPVDIIYESIKKFEENKSCFTKEEWEDIDVFYESCITKSDFPAYVDFSIHFPTADIVANMVKEAGGKVFIAHAYKYNLENTISFLDILRDNGIIDGVEVYHSSFSDAQIKTLETYCNKHKLFISDGSDCHGDKRHERKVGVGYGNLNIPKNILNNWDIQEKLI